MSDKKAPLDEKKAIGSSYIIQFARNVMSMNNSYSDYFNFMVYLESKYGNVENQSMEDLEKNQFIEVIQKIRFECTNCYIQFMTLAKITGQEDKEILNNYNLIKTQLILNRDDLLKYIVALNAYLVKDIVKKLLESSQDYIQEVYGTDNQQ